MVTFKTFILESKSDVLADWYVEHPFEKKRWQQLWARYYNMCMHLRDQPIGGWSETYFHKLQGYEGLGRIGFDYRGIAFRHIGFYGPGQQEFSILFAAEEKDWIYKPRGCIEAAFERMKLAKANSSRVRIATIQVPPEHV